MGTNFDFETIKSLFAGIILLAVFVEGFIEYFVAEPLKQWGVMSWQQFLKKYFPRYFAIVIGEVVAFGFRTDMPGAFGLTSTWTWLPFAVTGIIISRGSNYVSTVWDAVRGTILALKAKANGNN